MSIETDTTGLIDQWLHGTLVAIPAVTSLAGGRVINAESPAAVQFPYVVFMNEDARDIRTADGFFISSEALYIVKVVGTGSSFAALRPLFVAINAAISNVRDTTSDLDLTCTREYVIAYPETIETRSYRHLGAAYRIRASAP